MRENLLDFYLLSESVLHMLPLRKRLHLRHGLRRNAGFLEFLVVRIRYQIE